MSLISEFFPERDPKKIVSSNIMSSSEGPSFQSKKFRQTTKYRDTGHYHSTIAKMTHLKIVLRVFIVHQKIAKRLAENEECFEHSHLSNVRN